MLVYIFNLVKMYLSYNSTEKRATHHEDNITPEKDVYILSFLILSFFS